MRSVFCSAKRHLPSVCCLLTLMHGTETMDKLQFTPRELRPAQTHGDTQLLCRWYSVLVQAVTGGEEGVVLLGKAQENMCRVVGLNSNQWKMALGSTRREISGCRNARVGWCGLGTACKACSRCEHRLLWFHLGKWLNLPCLSLLICRKSIMWTSAKDCYEDKWVFFIKHMVWEL